MNDAELSLRALTIDVHDAVAEIARAQMPSEAMGEWVTSLNSAISDAINLVFAEKIGVDLSL